MPPCARSLLAAALFAPAGLGGPALADVRDEALAAMGNTLAYAQLCRGLTPALTQAQLAAVRALGEGTGVDFDSPADGATARRIAAETVRSTRDRPRFCRQKWAAYRRLS